MEIFYTHKAANDLKKFSLAIQRRIATKMRFYAQQEDPLHFAKRLVNTEEGEYRFRVGDYRIFIDAQGDAIFVLKIAKRDKAYE